jgi:hypothetical protein
MTSRKDVARAREILSSLVDISGLSHREIERRLAREEAGLDVNRLLTGRFAMRLHQVVDVLDVLKVHPVEFFRLVFGEPEMRSPLLVRAIALFTPPGRRL